MNNNKPVPAVGIALLAVSLVLVVGVLSFAGPCGVHDDGSLSSCHWAARSVAGAGAVAAVLAAVRVFERDEGERRGLSLAIACVGVLVACLPGTLVNLCMMQTMRCHAIMRPFCVGCGLTLAVVGGTDLVVRLVRARKA